jgi:ribosomal protein S18 acetylase RimI-like enzyme
MIRKANPEDLDTVRELWEALYGERPQLEHRRKDWSDVVDDVRQYISENVALIAEEDEGAVGFALAWPENDRVGHLGLLYVRPEFRRRGIARALIREAAARLDREFLTLKTETQDAAARAFYNHLGFKEESVNFVIDSQQLSEQAERAPSFGSVHVQTDDAGAVARAAAQFVPRLPGRSAGSVVVPPRNGWVAVYDELCDREPSLLQRLARELSDRMGAVVLAIGLERGEVVRFNLLERGRSVDEYLSVPTYYGDVAPGDIVALGANPAVVGRLTGADRERFRAVARTATSPSELPPPPELLAAIAQEMKIEGATYGYAEAAGLPGAVAL